MSTIIFITGGERSGKSSFAQQMALKLSDSPVFLATARVWDQDFAQRIERHKDERDERWTTVEEDKKLSNHKLAGKVVVLDCITLWLTNMFADDKFNFEKSLAEAQDEWNRFMNQDFTLIVVSNEIGMSLHAQTESGRKFVELQGRINQYIAGMADEAYLMVSGISLKIKPHPTLPNREGC
jgi:adenosylcobinamide kinase/adenosylcobinamide-phosphate guanylyltransferase